MSESTICHAPTTHHYSPCAVLAGMGIRLRALDVFGPIQERVRIAQKVVTHTPADKLYDAFITILAGAQGLVEVNTRLRADPALQRAMGRTACAEQSVVQDTLDACTQENVAQMHEALAAIYRRHGQGYRHDYAQGWQVLDGDISGLPCGPKAAFATKGYFAKQRNRRGRQIGRVLASHYSEVVVDRVFPGTTQLAAALPGLIAAAERTLGLDEDAPKRARTIVRIDGVEDVNGLLERSYAVHAKDYSPARAYMLAPRVTDWVDDPHVSGRQHPMNHMYAQVPPLDLFRRGAWRGRLEARDCDTPIHQVLTVLDQLLHVLGRDEPAHDQEALAMKVTYSATLTR